MESINDLARIRPYNSTLPVRTLDIQWRSITSSSSSSFCDRDEDDDLRKNWGQQYITKVSENKMKNVMRFEMECKWTTTNQSIRIQNVHSTIQFNSIQFNGHNTNEANDSLVEKNNELVVVSFGLSMWPYINVRWNKTRKKMRVKERKATFIVRRQMDCEIRIKKCISN